MSRREEFYIGDQGRAYHEAVHGDQLTDRRTFVAKSLLAQHRYFRETAPEARILEYGVGIGTNLASLPNEVRHGFDVSGFALAESRKSGIETFDDTAALPKGFYDIVLCRHVLEHVPDPITTLLDIRSLLRADGTLILILPVERSSKRYRAIPSRDTNNHLYAWNLQHAANLLEFCEFRPERHRYFPYSMQRKLAAIPRVAGVASYSALVSLAGRLRRQYEVAVWARPDA